MKSRTHSRSKHNIVVIDGLGLLRHYHWAVERVGEWMLATRLDLVGYSTGLSTVDLETCTVGWRLALLSVSWWPGR